MQRFLILGALGLVVGTVGLTGYGRFADRMKELDEFRRKAPGETRKIAAELRDAQHELANLKELARAMEELRGEMHALEAELEGTAERVIAQNLQLSVLAAQQEEFGPRDLNERIDAVEAGVLERWNGLRVDVSNAVSAAAGTQEKLDAIGARLDLDIDTMWREIVGPTVQLAGETTVGSGVLLRSTPMADSEGYETLLITSWHVVRDIRADADGEDPPIPVSIYSQNGAVRSETAELLHFSTEIDIALLRLNTTDRLECGAALAPRQRLESMTIFEEIYAVGCPLGNDPIPTPGEVADTSHLVDGGTYWMISAPTYIGNSGGGIFDAESHELLAIFSKIYTHGSLRPTIVPHMGLATPLTYVYDWLDEQGIALSNDHVATAETTVTIDDD